MTIRVKISLNTGKKKAPDASCFQRCIGAFYLELVAGLEPATC